MSEPISVECPMCGAAMKLRDRSKLGRKASCPNCSNLFILTEGETDAKSPRASGVRRQPAPALPPRKGGGKSAGERIRAGQAGGGSKAGLFIGGTVLLLLLVAGGLWIAGVFSGGGDPDQNGGNGKNPPAVADNKIDLSYLPPDAEAVIKVQVAVAWRSPLLAQLHQMPAVVEGLAGLQETLGLTPDDVESLTIGLVDVSKQARQGMEAGPQAAASQARENFTAAARLKKKVDAKSLKLVENGGVEKKYEGKAYYLFEPPGAPLTPQQGPDGSQAKPLAVYLAEAKLVVLGSEELVKVAISMGGEQARRQEFDFVDPDSHLLIAFVPQDKSALTDALPATGGPEDPAGELRAIAMKGLKGVSLGVSVRSGIALEVRGSCVDEKSAGDLKSLLDGLVAEGRASLQDPNADSMMGLLQPLESILGSVKTASNASTVTVSARVSEQTIASVKEMAPLLMLMLAANGGLFPGAGVIQPPVDLPTAAPEGLEVSAIARWNELQSFGFGEEPVPPPELQLWVYLIGKQAEAAVAWGRVQVNDVTADGGRKLQVKSNAGDPADPTTAFLRVERGGFRREHPQHGMRAALTFVGPGQPIATITKATGTVSLQVAKEQKLVVLKNAASLAGKPIDDPIVKEAGLELELSKDDMGFSVKLVKGNPFALAGVLPVDAAGKPLEFAGSSRSEFGGQVVFGVFPGDDAPADVGLQLTINVGISQVDVPFDVSDVRVPLPPGAPGKPPAATDGIPEGLTIAAKTTWSDTFGPDQNGDEPPPALQVQITSLGETAKKCVAWGFLTVKEAKGTNDVALKLRPQQFTFGGDPAREYVRIDHDAFDSKHPPDGVASLIVLEHPPAKITEIAGIEGAFKLRTANEQKVVPIASFPGLAGTSIEDADLKAAGLSLKIEGKEDEFKLLVEGGNDDALAKVEVLDATGRKAGNLSVSRVAFGKETYYQISSFGGNVPEKTTLKLTVNFGLTEVDVPFRFENIPVPDLPIK